jgi:hypothetical protein
MIQPKRVARLVMFIVVETLIYVLIAEFAPSFIKAAIILAGMMVFFYFIYRLYQGKPIHKKPIANHRFQAVSTVLIFFLITALLYWHTKGDLNSLLMFTLLVSTVYNPYLANLYKSEEKS